MKHAYSGKFALKKARVVVIACGSVVAMLAALLLWQRVSEPTSPSGQMGR